MNITSSYHIVWLLIQYAKSEAVWCWMDGCSWVTGKYFSRVKSFLSAVSCILYSLFVRRFRTDTSTIKHHNFNLVKRKPRTKCILLTLQQLAWPTCIRMAHQLQQPSPTHPYIFFPSVVHTARQKCTLSVYPLWYTLQHRYGVSSVLIVQWCTTALHVSSCNNRIVIFWSVHMAFTNRHYYKVCQYY